MPKHWRVAARTRCNRCHRRMAGTTAYDGACECGGLIEVPEEHLPGKRPYQLKLLNGRVRWMADMPESWPPCTYLLDVTHHESVFTDMLEVPDICWPTSQKEMKV